MMQPKVNSIKKSGKIVGTPPDKPEFAQMKYPQGNPSRRSNLSVKK